MMKKVFLTIYLISSFGKSSSSFNIRCEYRYKGYSVLGKIYHCLVNDQRIDNNPTILTADTADISEINGTFDSPRSIDDVTGFRAENIIIYYFPKGLDKFFKNLKMISILSCQLKEIHQSDLKPFPNLVYFQLAGNEIEVIEAGLFDFNPNLEVVGFEESKIFHIDPNVFDNLDKLSYFGLSSVSCVRQSIMNSKEEVQAAIKVVKSECTNLEFLSFYNQYKNLEKELKTLNSEDFNIKLEIFEKTFKNSKYFKYRPFSYRFQIFKLKAADNFIFERNILKSKNVKLDNDLKNITGRIDDIKLSQFDIKLSLNELKSSQNDTTTAIRDLKLTQDSLKNSQDFSLTNLTSKFNALKKDIKTTQDDTKLSINDIEVKLSDQKSFQNDVKDALLKVRTMQNEIKLTLNDVRNSKNEGFKDKLVDFVEKVETLEGHDSFVEFKAEMAEKLDKNEKELTNKFHKMSTNFDGKIKGIENRLMKKFEEILEEKLGRIFDEKLGNLINAKKGTE